MSICVVIVGSDLNQAWDWVLMKYRSVHKVSAAASAGSSDWTNGRAYTAEEKLALVKDVRELWVIVPGMSVRSKTILLENVNKRQFESAAKYSIEDEIATSLDDNHFVFNASGQYAKIIAHTYLGDLLSTFETIGIRPDKIFADYDALGDGEIFRFNNRVIAKPFSSSPYALELDTAEAMNMDEAIHAPLIDANGLIQKLLYKFKENEPIDNLLSGPYRSKNGASRKEIMQIAALIIAAFVLGFGLIYANGKRFEHARVANLDKISQIYQDIFAKPPPKSGAIKATISARASLGETDTTFMELSSRLWQALKDINGVEIEAMKYADNKPGLILSLSYKDLNTVEKLQRKLNALGVEFIESGTQKNGDIYRGDAVIRRRS